MVHRAYSHESVFTLNPFSPGPFATLDDRSEMPLHLKVDQSPRNRRYTGAPAVIGDAS